ncbi:Crp/Fnr family transcriptional regulator [Lachnospiraceae bacterium LCP25S3_G4]
MAKHVCAEHVPLFNHLDHESLEMISSIMRYCVMKKGEIISAPGRSANLFILARGRVKVYQISSKGKEQLLRIIEPGNVFGESSIFDSKNENNYCEALTDVEVCMITHHDFKELLLKYPEISIKLLEEYSSRLKSAEQQTTRTANEQVIDRLRSYLEDLSLAADSKTFVIPMSMRELSDFLATSPETLSRNIRKLESDGTIRRKCRNVTLMDK